MIEGFERFESESVEREREEVKRNKKNTKARRGEMGAESSRTDRLCEWFVVISEETSEGQSGRMVDELQREMKMTQEGDEWRGLTGNSL